MSESRAGYENHPLSLEEVCFFYHILTLKSMALIFPLYYIHFEITGDPCNLIGSVWFIHESPIFCGKSHLFLSQKKRNTKTAQPNRFQILLKETNQISGEMDVKKRPCQGGGGVGPMSPIWILKHLMSVFINACRLLSALPSLSQFGQGRLSLVTISLYALSLLFGPCRLLEFTLAGPQ